jgi:hypothetical protein
MAMMMIIVMIFVMLIIVMVFVLEAPTTFSVVAVAAIKQVF